MKALLKITLLLAAAVLLMQGCGENIEGERKANLEPETYISSGPPDQIDDTSYRVRLYWNGYDPDGEVVGFEFLITDDYETGSLLIDREVAIRLEDMGYEWTFTAIKDSTFIVEASQIPDIDNPEDAIYFYGDRFRFKGQHTFFLRAVDEFGRVDSLPAHRTFTATTIAPSVTISHPSDTGSAGGWEHLPPDIYFNWTGNDSVGEGGLIISPDSTRTALFKKGEYDIDPVAETGYILDLPEEVWSIWRAWDADEDSVLHISGTGALVSGLTPAGPGEDGDYFFLIQAKDEAGAVTSHFEDGRNLKKIHVISTLFPILSAEEPTLGLWVAEGYAAYDFTIGEGQAMNVSWEADASHYGSRITGYRHGWDISDTGNDDEWTNWSTNETSTTATFVSGTHSLHIECRDKSGNVSTVVFRFLVIPFTMDNELLLVDDHDNSFLQDGYPLGEPTASWTNNLARSDEQMKAFWDDVLGDYVQWQPDRDFFRTTAVNNKPPFALIAAYKHVVWETVGSLNGNGLYRIAKFADPNYASPMPFDYVSAYMNRGGQIFLLGGTPVYSIMSKYGDVQPTEFLGRTPLAYMRVLEYSTGDSDAAVRRYLPYEQFGIDIIMKAIEPQPRPPLDDQYYPYQTNRTHWGMVAADATYLEVANDDPNAVIFPNEYPLPERLTMSAEVWDWFNYAAEALESVGSHGFFGLPDTEIYNWDWYATGSNSPLDPPVVYREDEFIKLLTYVPADSSTRYGEHPVRVHQFLDEAGEPYNEINYCIPHVVAPGDTVYGSAYGPEYGHAVGLVGLKDPETPNVVLGFHPYYLRRDTAKQLVDHILVDILGVSKGE